MSTTNTQTNKNTQTKNQSMNSYSYFNLRPEEYQPRGFASFDVIYDSMKLNIYDTNNNTNHSSTLINPINPIKSKSQNSTEP